MDDKLKKHETVLHRLNSSAPMKSYIPKKTYRIDVMMSPYENKFSVQITKTFEMFNIFVV